MRAWDKVYEVGEIKLTVNDGLDEANIFGNTRNCVPVTVYFNGYDKKGDLVDLSKEKFSSADVQLINQGTGEELPVEFGKEYGSGLIFSEKQGNFCQAPIIAPRSTFNPDEKFAKRGKVIFYVYGNTEALISKRLGARFVFYNGDEAKPYSTAMDNRTSQFVKINILPGIMYDLSDIEPFEWKESSHAHDKAVQWDGYIKLNSKHPNMRWIESHFEGYNFTSGRFALFQNEWYAYSYFMWPLGRETTEELSVPEMKVCHNKVRGALNIAILRGSTGGTPNFFNDVLIRLYDIHGNEGRFKMDWSTSDKKNATIKAAN